MTTYRRDETSPRGTCPTCGRRAALRKDGKVGRHLIYGAGFGGQPLACDGAGRYPVEEDDA